ncbi:MAG: gamma-glutamylcyclotransferase [Alphaproteobacteria bacterium]|nr:gamma-glutamylcyclotransferase [Alphaproteobacteria bacterium]
MLLYFAFDELMDPARMAALSPQVRSLGHGCLPRHRLLVMSGPRATIGRDPLREVQGTLYEVPMAAMPLLDRRFSGASKIIQPIIGQGGSKRAVMHLLPEKLPPASQQDRVKLVEAARAALLPDAYCEEIETGMIARRKVGVPLFKAPTSSFKS